MDSVEIDFGGGARDQETFAPEGQANIPHLLQELAPQSTFFTHMMNRGILGHYVATASLVTGVYETLNNFSAVPPANPTAFEYFRARFLFLGSKYTLPMLFHTGIIFTLITLILRTEQIDGK